MFIIHRQIKKRFQVPTLILTGLLGACTGDNNSSSESSQLVSSATPTSSSETSSSSTLLISSSSTASFSSSSSSSAAKKLVVAINSGAAGFTAGNITYKDDDFYSDGKDNVTTDAIANTENDNLYQSERYGSYSYNIPVTNANYSVTLHFVELFHTTDRSRSFNVAIEGREVISALDLHASAGHDVAYSRTFDDIAVSDGKLTIDLETLVDNATISGIVITSVDGEFVAPPPPALTTNITLNPNQKFQKIAGFGAGLPMWIGELDASKSALTKEMVHKAVGTGEGELGLSILRTIIRHDPDMWPYLLENLQEAKAYGDNIKVLGSPWTPPAEWKTNNELENGGSLRREFWDDYAFHLNDYVQYMASEGVTIDVVSIQNEPDWHPDYDSCDWTGNDFRDFLREHGPKIQGPRLLVGESLRFDRSYTDPTLNDPAAVNNMDIVGGHLYSARSSGTFGPYPLAEQKGKEIWMTEWLSHEADGNGADIWGGNNRAVWDETLDTVMLSVHDAMTYNWNAYIWWWACRFYSFIGDGDFGTTEGEILKRGWAFSHYSKFVRPDFTRIGLATDTKTRNLKVTAYQGDNVIVAVILNTGSSAVNDVVFEIPQTITNAEAYTTSQAKNRARTAIDQEAEKVGLTIDARSITTVIMHF